MLKLYKFKKSPKKVWPILVCVVLVGIAGSASLLRSFAFTPHVSTEAELGSRGAVVASVNDATASDGKGIKFGSIANLGSKGFGMSVPDLPSQSVAIQDQWLADMQSMGISWIRIDMDWSAVQPNNATTYDWSRYDTALAEAQKYGIKVDGIIDYTAPWARSSSCSQSFQCQPTDMATYATYAKSVVQHFGTKLGAIEIWNEPNIPNFWLPAPDATAYVNMLRQAYTAIKSVAPHMPIISAGLSPSCTCGSNVAPVDFVSAMYGAGAKPYFDILGDHPYSYPAPPSDNQPWSGWSQMNDTNPSVRSVMTANGDGNKPLWMTEVGAPTNGPGLLATCSDYGYTVHPDHVDDCLQNKIYTDIITISKSQSWSGVTFFYSYKDAGTTTDTNENFFGVIRANGSKKPAYDTIKTLLNQ